MKGKQNRSLFEQSSAMIHMGWAGDTVDIESDPGKQRPAAQSTA